MKRLLSLWVSRTLGVLLLLISLIGMISPFPGSSIIPLIFGLALLVPNTPLAAEILRWLRQKIGAFDRFLKKLEPKAPATFKRVINMTEPN